MTDAHSENAVPRSLVLHSTDKPASSATGLQVVGSSCSDGQFRSTHVVVNHDQSEALNNSPAPASIPLDKVYFLSRFKKQLNSHFCW